nr:FkbM family methyltransferase [Desulfobacterales bacterium]
MIRRILRRIRDEKPKDLVLYVKSCLFRHPVLDRFWLLINYYLHPSRKVVRKVQGSRMVLDLSDRGISRDLFLYGVREPECTRIFKDELSRGMRVVDIGSNIGYYVLIAAQSIGNSGRIYAIEPEPRNFEMLKKNVEMNSYGTHITFYNMAISNRVGKCQFITTDTFNTHRLATSKSNEDCMEVDTTTLDELFGDEIDFVRMDTEGAEWLIFMGMKHILDSHRPLKLFIEIHPRLIGEYGGNVEEVLNLLSNAGFDLKYLVLFESYRFVIPYIKGKGEVEKSIKFNKPLGSLLLNQEIRNVLVPKSNFIHRAGYRLFLEKNIKDANNPRR